MDTRIKVTAIFIVFAVFLFAVWFVSQQPQPLQAEISIIPDTINVGANYPFFEVTIKLSGSHKVGDINVSTVKLETLSPTSSEIENEKLLLEFDGDEVIDLIKPIVIHDYSYNVELKVSGKLVDGTPFHGSAFLEVKMYG